MATKSELTTVKADLGADIAVVNVDICSKKADIKGEISELSAETRDIRQVSYNIITESEMEE